MSATRQVAAEERANAIARDLETLNKANSLIESGRSHVDFSEWAKAEADLTAAVEASARSFLGVAGAWPIVWTSPPLDLAAADFQKACKLHDQGSVQIVVLSCVLASPHG